MWAGLAVTVATSRQIGSRGIAIPTPARRWPQLQNQQLLWVHHVSQTTPPKPHMWLVRLRKNMVSIACTLVLWLFLSLRWSYQKWMVLSWKRKTSYGGNKLSCGHVLLGVDHDGNVKCTCYVCVCSWLRDLNEYGICLLTNLPTEHGTIKKV